MSKHTLHGASAIRFSNMMKNPDASVMKKRDEFLSSARNSISVEVKQNGHVVLKKKATN